jgi:hypothetical protein
MPGSDVVIGWIDEYSEPTFNVISSTACLMHALIVLMVSVPYVTVADVV